MCIVITLKKNQLWDNGVHVNEGRKNVHDKDNSEWTCLVTDEMKL